MCLGDAEGWLLFVGAVRIQGDVEQVQLAHVTLVVGQNVGQFGQADGQCVCGPHNGRGSVVGVVFTHEPRGHVDADHFGLGGIDELDQSGKSAAQRLVDADAKQGVNY